MFAAQYCNRKEKMAAATHMLRINPGIVEEPELTSSMYSIVPETCCKPSLPQSLESPQFGDNPICHGTNWQQKGDCNDLILFN